MALLCARILTVALLGLHLGLSFADLQHVDFVLAGSSEREAVASHDCGSREIHTSLDSVHFCIPCFRNAAGVALANLYINSFPPPVVRRIAASLCDRTFTGFNPQTY
ncbi:MAG TPA: hypothetical protein VGA55_06045, partial [Bacteroidota bacterium]